MFTPFKQFFRFIKIIFILVRYRLDEIVLSIPVLAPLSFLAYLNPWYWWFRDPRPRAARLRGALETLGPIYVKFGQALATRNDILPDDIADGLAGLVDKVPPFESELAVATIEKALKQTTGELFKSFSDAPLASASVAQVHAAVLLDGRDVVVKVLRPGIRKVIKSDVRLLYFFARLAERYWRDTRRLKPVAVVAEFEKTILDELDFLREAANASQLRRNFIDSDLIYVPEIYWPYARTDVMVMERIYGIQISDTQRLRRENVNMKKLAERGVEIFYTQVFRDCFFHADMHAGNIFVDASVPDDPKYIAVDFGIMGTLNRNDQRYLAENFLAFFQRDYRRVAELHIESGWVPYVTRSDEFESAIRTVCEPIYERPLKDISCAAVLLRLFQTAGRFEMEVQPQLVLLQKTLLAVEGLGRQLYPDLDLWSTAKPFLEKWMKTQVGVRAMLKGVSAQYPYWTEKFPEVPDLVYKALNWAKDESLQRKHLGEDKKRRAKERCISKQRSYWQGVTSTALLSAASIYLIVHHVIVWDAAMPWFIGVLSAVGVVGLAKTLRLKEKKPWD